MHRIRIADPEALQAVLAEVSAEHANQEAAAKHLGIAQPTLSRLLSGNSGESMAYATFTRILEAFGGSVQRFELGLRPVPFAVGAEHLMQDDRDRLVFRVERERRSAGSEGSDSDPSPQDILDAEAESQHDLLTKFLSAVLSDDDEYVRSNYEAWMDLELERLRNAVGSVLQELWDDPKSKKAISGFLRRIDRKSDELPDTRDRRCWLALYRVAEPLAASSPTWGVERSWEELKEAGEGAAYLKSALKREELLLKPTREAERVIRGKPPMGFWESMELMAAKEDFFERNPKATEEDWEECIDGADPQLGE